MTAQNPANLTDRLTEASRRRQRAARAVAHHAADAAEAAMLLDMLGLDAAEGRHYSAATPEPAIPAQPTVSERAAQRQFKTGLLSPFI